MKSKKPIKPKLPKKPVKANNQDYFDSLAESSYFTKNPTSWEPAPCEFEDDSTKISKTMTAIEAEIHRAVSLHGPMKSLHEGYAVILEEMDELWDQVKLKAKLQDPKSIREEAIQIAAMAARLVVDLL